MWEFRFGACRGSPHLYLFSTQHAHFHGPHTYEWVCTTNSLWVQSNKGAFLYQLFEHCEFHSLISCHWLREIPNKPPLTCPHLHTRLKCWHEWTRAHKRDIPWHGEKGLLSHRGSLLHWNATDMFHRGIEGVLTNRARGTSQSLKEDH